ncbi:basic membrane protein A [Ilumatobacter fluminis]|uniref:Basic membrane protein A n=1 Tax=Ilumatobacter fluminis TaxID=467091 RepID=A0A4R7HWQ7_9ACTN|nr:BMP family ABC transporter substrate-binding protein [Ilumatobacter fluminis]TDT15552.1 basic membrane protein A [Ilumatobacter fluminis]
MIKSKRLLAAGLAASLVLAACGDDDDTADEPADDAEEPAEEPSDDAEEPAEEPSEEPAGESFNVGLTYDIGGRGDQSFNDSAAEGIDRAESELGITFTEAEPNVDGSNRAELLQLQADQSALVIGVGFLFAGDVATVSAENPDTNFAVVDDAMLDFDNGGVPVCDNCAGLTFAEEQGSFLVGAAAALNSESGTVGFIGGVGGFGLIEKFEAGFIEGVKAVDPEITVISQYITQAPDFDGFTAPDRAREIALAMYDQGADVIYHAAGGSGAGLFEAAAEQSESSGSKVWAIGVDSDQYLTAAPEVQEYILTSMLKRVDTAVFEITKAQQDGTFAAGNTVYDLSVDGVGYSTSGDFLSEEQITQIEDFKAQIIDGTIEVPTTPAG